MQRISMWSAQDRIAAEAACGDLGRLLGDAAEQPNATATAATFGWDVW
jgi:hypothetical protein